MWRLVTTQELLTAGFLGLGRRFLADLKPQRASLCVFCRAGVRGLCCVHGRGLGHGYYFGRKENISVVLQDSRPALRC